MGVFLIALALYALGLVLSSVGSRLCGRCATWCCALCGLPMWVVGGTVASLCVAMPQLMLSFLASGLFITPLAVGVALASSVAVLGLALALCLLRRDIVVERGEFCRKCLLLLAGCLVLTFFVRDGVLSYTGTGLLMALFVLFVLQNITYQYRYLFDRQLRMIDTSPSCNVPAVDPEAYTVQTMAFPTMNLRNSLKNLAGVLFGGLLLAVGATALLYSAVTLANLTGTIQALWASTLLALGFSLPLLAEVLHHPLGSAWKRFSERCRFYPAKALPMQLLNCAILHITFVLPISSLMYRQRLPVGAQYRKYDVPACILLALILLLPPLFKKRLYRAQGTACLLVYIGYLAAVLLVPLAGA